MPRNYGIDLGTTNTVVCKFESLKIMDNLTSLNEIPIYYPKEQSQKLKDYTINGKFSLPSLLYLESDPNTPSKYIHYAGEVADQLASNNINNVKSLFINTKRLMSKTKNLGHGIKARDVAKDLYEICFYSIKQNSNRKELSSTQSFCVTHPAAFNPFAKVAITDVVKEFGYSNINTLQEPEAALLHHLYELLESPQKERALFQKQSDNGGHLIFGVVDIGGGTTDVTIKRFKINGTRETDCQQFATGYVITFQNEEINGKQSQSNPYESFGGLDFDRAAAEYIIGKINTVLANEKLPLIEHLSNNKQTQIEASAMHEAKQFKEQMDGTHTSAWVVPSSLLDTEHDIRIEWNEQEYNEWVAPLCKSDTEQDVVNVRKLTIHTIIENTLKRSHYAAEDLDCIFVTGGMSLYNPIRNMLIQEYADKTELRFSKTPLLDIARGAALYNAYFQINVPIVTLNEGIMIDNPCGEPIMLAPSGKRLPYSNDVNDKIVITNPVKMQIHILSGLNAFDPNMRLIKRLCANKLTPTRVGIPVDIHFEITENEKISLSFHVKQSECDYYIPIDSDDYEITIAERGNSNEKTTT